VVHLHSYKPQSGPLLMIKCCISVFHCNSVNIPNDRMGIEVHDYVEFSKKISVYCQESYRMCLMTQNGHLHETPKKKVFVS
jgi:hypothetical protein